MNIILAPHVDDEALGCWSVFTDRNLERRVHYFFECTEARIAEAKAACSAVGASCTFECIEPFQLPDDYDALYVPAFSDSHFAHRVVNTNYRSYATHFYAVDHTKHRVPLPQDQQEAKARFLLRYYPSQSSYFSSHSGSSIFEDIAETDCAFTVVATFENVKVSVTARKKVDLDAFMLTHRKAIESLSYKPTTSAIDANALLNVLAFCMGPDQLDSAIVEVRISSSRTLKVSI